LTIDKCTGLQKVGMRQWRKHVREAEGSIRAPRLGVCPANLKRFFGAQRMSKCHVMVNTYAITNTHITNKQK
jgi:hypothetical protein